MTTTANRSIARSPIVWVVGLIVIAFVVAVLASGGDEETSTATEIAAVTIDGDALPAFTTGDDPAVGSTAPGFAGVSFDDSAVDTSEPAARVVGFFAHWCPHCQRELPIVEEWLDEGLLPDGVEFVAVSTAVESGADNYPPSAWFSEVGYDATVMVDDGDSSVANAYGLTGFPFWVVTNADGEVVLRVGGGVDRTGFEALGSAALEG